VLGTVVNHLNASHAGYYHYGYHYYYYDSENGRRKKHRRSLRLRWPWQRPPQLSSAGKAQVETLVEVGVQEQLVSPTLTVSANAALMRGEMSQASTRSPSPTLKLETGKRMPQVRVVNDPPAVQEAELLFGGVGQAIYSRFEIRPFPSMPGKTGTINEKPALTATDLEMASETQRTGYTMLRALDRLGFAHSGNGSAAYAICFSQVTLYGHLAAYEVDSEWLAFSVDSLARSDVLAQLSAAMRKPVKAFTQGGLTYVVELQSRPGARQAAKDSASFDFWANRVVW